MPDSTNQLARLNAALAERYRVDRELGRGGMATVYLGQDLRNDRAVALKVLRPELAAALGSERFLREVRITARLNHPHIVPLLDSGEMDGFLYYAMPYVEGDSLRERIVREKQLPLDDALQLGREVADALSYAHSHDVVHRDIKPENVLLESGHAVVADFGIARAITAAGGDRLTETGITMGTPAYMSPEQAAGSADLDGRSDLYSLGCVLYEMLAGHPPFTGTTAREVLARQSLDAVPLLAAARPAVPLAVERAIHTVLAKAPTDRFATASQFADALGHGAEAVAPGAVAGRAWWARPLVIGGAAVVLVGAVLVAKILVRRYGAPINAAASRVAVLPFENRTAVSALDPLATMAAEWVTQGLTEVPFLTVIDTRMLGAVGGPVAVGRETGAGVVVVGSYFLQGDSLQFQAQIASTADGSALFAIGGVTAPRDRPLEGVEQVRQRVAAGLASLLDRDVTSFETRISQPPTYAAYREYVEGLKEYVIGGQRDYRNAAQHFQHAAELDSTWLTPRVWAAQAIRLFDGGSAKADTLIEALQQIRYRLPPFDLARLDFVVALRHDDVLEAYSAASRLVDASPGSIDARREAALSALRVLRPREALGRLGGLNLEQGLMRDYGPYFVVAWAQHLLGQHEDELAAARRSRELDQSTPFPLYLELRALAALGRAAELDSLARAELPASGGQAGIIAFGVAGELMAHGYPEAARRLARYAAELPTAPPRSDLAAEEWLQVQRDLRRQVGDPYLGGLLEQRSPLERARYWWIHWRAELALFLGDAETAATLATQLRDTTQNDLLHARILAAEGRLGAARESLQNWEARALRTRGSLRNLEIDRASVLVRVGDLDGALEILSEGLTRGAIFNTTLGQDGHAYPDLAPLWSNPRFQALIKPKG